MRKPSELGGHLRLLAVEGVGSVRAAALVARFGGPDAVFGASVDEIAEVEGIGPKTAGAIASGADDKWVGEQIASLEKAGAVGVILGDEDYPAPLASSPDPPLVLFVLGEIKKEDEIALAVVGTRRMSPYGRRATSRIVGPLAARGVAIISGLARGVDAEAHKAALDAGGRTIAVFGSGIDVIYPPEHAKLAERIAERGAIATEFPCGTRPDVGTFPRRNRIIAGLGQGVLVVEAGERSGALITARLALEMGREVLAVPGNVDAAKSVGTNSLIRQGAAMITSADDVVAELEHAWGAKLKAERKTPAEPPPDLEGDEAAVFSVLTEEPKHIDAVAEDAGIPPSAVMAALLSLELRGVVRQSAGKHFTKTGG